MANSFIDVNDKLVEYFYKIDNIYILIKNKEAIEIPVERIRGVKLILDYEKASLPIFGISMLMEPSRYYKIMNNKKDVLFKIRLQCYYRDKHSLVNSMSVDCINETFKLYSEDYNDDYESNLKKTINKDISSEDGINDLEKLKNEVEFYLFRTYINGLRSNINTVVTNSDLTTTIAYLLSKAEVTNVLMSPLTNNTIYDSIVIPPLTIDNAIKYLNNNYGLHKFGTMIFYDLDRSYIINYKEKCTAWEKGEITDTVLYVLDKSIDSSYQPGGIIKIDQKKNYYNISSESININSKTISTNVLTGTDLTLINQNENNTVDMATNSNIVDKINKSVLFNDVSNPYLGYTYSMLQYSNSTIITLSTAGLNIKDFTPNKSFTFVFQDILLNKKYTGTYRLVSAIHTFTGSGLRYDLTSILIFKKISGVNENKGDIN